jgi:hypothetical protein
LPALLKAVSSRRTPKWLACAFESGGKPPHSKMACLRFRKRCQAAALQNGLPALLKAVSSHRTPKWLACAFESGGKPPHSKMVRFDLIGVYR